MKLRPLDIIRLTGIDFPEYKGRLAVVLHVEEHGSAAVELIGAPHDSLAWIDAPGGAVRVDNLADIIGRGATP